MGLEDYEFVARGIIYEVYKGVIHRGGRDKGIKFLGVCPSKIINEISSTKGEAITQKKVGQDGSGEDIWEFLFDEHIALSDLGNLVEEVSVGSCLVGKLGNEIWVSPEITLVD